MTSGIRKLAVLAGVAGLCLAGFLAVPAVSSGGLDELDRLTRPARVVLDFQDQPVASVVKVIAERSGRRVDAAGEFTKGFNLGDRDQGWRERRVTLLATEPVPFWDAIDRLAAAGKLRYRLASSGDTGFETTFVLFEGEGEVPGLACYAGPFRVELQGVHEHREAVLVRAPWVQVYPSGYPAPAEADELGEAPPDGGPLYAELRVAAEPGLLGRRDGPLRGLEAADEAGRSLLAPPRETEKRRFSAYDSFVQGTSPILRVPLRRDAGGSKTLARLRGSIPVEVGVVRSEPALVIRLSESEGKTFRSGGALLTVKTARVEPDGRVKIELTGRLEDPADQPARNARLTLLTFHQYRLVDATGAPVRWPLTGSSGGDLQGGFRIAYEYSPGPGSGPPAEFRYYEVDRTPWAIPFEFRDVPLP